MFLKGYWINHTVTRLDTSPCHSWAFLGSHPGAYTTDAPMTATITRIIASALLETKYRGCHLSRVDFTQLLAVNSVLGRCVLSAGGEGDRLLADRKVGKASIFEFLLLKWRRSWLHNVGDPPDPERGSMPSTQN